MRNLHGVRGKHTVERCHKRSETLVQQWVGKLIPPTAIPLTPPPEAVKKLNGRDALLRVRDGKPNTDAEHRVPTGS
ncbi:MAG: hypothetical protein L0387_40245, partial [Acidobacteria bacterium]|nr:hypothetical protein [Acidobacteriota bacterium]